MSCKAGTRLASRLADDDGGVAGGQRLGALVLKLDGAWAVDKGEMVVQEFGIGDVERRRSYRERVPRAMHRRWTCLL